jgi:hypothetical protein
MVQMTSTEVTMMKSDTYLLKSMDRERPPTKTKILVMMAKV